MNCAANLGEAQAVGHRQCDFRNHVAGVSRHNCGSHDAIDALLPVDLHKAVIVTFQNGTLYLR